MIEAKNLVKHYGDKKAVNDVSFTVNDNEVLGFLGPNGAGKSTTMNMLTGYISMTSGGIRIGGTDILENPIEAKKKIGYLPEQPPLYPELTVKEYLHFASELKGIKDIKKAVGEVSQKTGLKDVMNRRIGNLSKGYKQRTGLAAALLGDPEVLILDEPTVGLDPKQIREIRALIRELGREHTVILSSHILPEIRAVSDRILVINKGRIAAVIDDPDGMTNEELEDMFMELTKEDGDEGGI